MPEAPVTDVQAELARFLSQLAAAAAASPTVAPVRKARDPISRLRTAIDCLPARTRRGDARRGSASSPIVVGAYTDSRGGVCPMLAAHRHGGRTSFVSFARAWDAFARTETIRRATERELRTLEHLLVASLAAEEETDLGAAIAEYRAAVGRRVPEILARRLKPRQARHGRADALAQAARTCRRRSCRRRRSSPGRTACPRRRRISSRAAAKPTALR